MAQIQAQNKFYITIYNVYKIREIWKRRQQLILSEMKVFKAPFYASNLLSQIFRGWMAGSVWGWQEVEKFNLVPSLFPRFLQKWLTNFGSISKTMVLSRPWSLTTSWKKSLKMLLESSTLLHGMKWALFLNLSSTTKMESNPLYVLVMWVNFRIVHLMVWH